MADDADRALKDAEVPDGAQAAPQPAVQQVDPIGYLAAYEIDRLKQGHDGHLRSPKFGPSPLDSDVPVYLGPLPTAGVLALVQKWRHAAEHLGLDGLASLADCADELEATLRASHGQAPAPTTQAAPPPPASKHQHSLFPSMDLVEE